MSAPVVDVLVAGSGATATAAALAAAAAGLSVRYAQHSGAVRGRHYALSRRSVNFLQQLNACPPLLPVENFYLYAGRWHNLSAAAPLCHMAEEGALADALSTALTAACEVGKVHTMPLADADKIILQSADEDSIPFHTQSQRGPDSVPCRARLVVAADGAESPLAKQLGITAAVYDFKQHAVVARVIAPSLRPDSAYQWFAENDIVALLPALPNRNAFSLVWSSANSAVQAAAQQGAAAVATALAQRTGLADLSISGGVDTFPLRARVRAARVAPRVALCGDAAGVVHPLAGQGLNLGLADAEELLRCVSRRLNGNIALGLAAYSRARSIRQWQLQGITRALLNERIAAGLLGLSHLPLLRQAAVAFANG